MKASLLCAVLPLRLRKHAASWVGRQSWIPERHWRAVALVRDLAQRDPEAYHRFLWSRHLGYAESYEPDERFGSLRPERQLLFQDLRRFLGERAHEVQSVLEVGCSLGHLLRAAETELFAHARVLEGLDIDSYAVRKGNERLRHEGSNVRLMTADMSCMDEVLPPAPRYDVVLCAGVLMYLKEEAARRVMKDMLDRSRLLVLSGLAHPGFDNRDMPCSQPRARDGAFIHNLDAMVGSCGGTVLFRRWQGSAPRGWNPPYFLFCSPGTP